MIVAKMVAGRKSQTIGSSPIIKIRDITVHSVQKLTGYLPDMASKNRFP